MLEVVLIWFAFGLVNAFIATAKGRAGFGWFLLGLLFSFFSTIVLIALPGVQEKKPYRMARAEEIKTCPDCGEPILKVAKVCKHCGYRYEQAA